MLVAQRAQEEEEAAAREDTEQVIRREQSDAELARKTSESLDKDRKQQKASDAAMAHNDVVLEFHTELQSAPAFPAPPPPRDFPPAVMAGSLPAGDDSFRCRRVRRGLRFGNGLRFEDAHCAWGLSASSARRPPATPLGARHQGALSLAPPWSMTIHKRGGHY